MTLVVENAEFISCVFGFCTLFVKAVLLQILTRLCDDKTEVSESKHSTTLGNLIIEARYALSNFHHFA